jgi:hypothetical protein
MAGDKLDTSGLDDPLDIEGAFDGVQHDDQGDLGDKDQGDQGDQGARGADDIQIEFVDDAGKDGTNDADTGATDDDRDRMDAAERGEDDEASADGNAADEAELQQYGKKVQDRIRRERRVTQREREAREAAERDAVQAQQVATKSVNEIAILRHSLALSTELNLKSKIEAAKAKLIAAKEAGKTEDEVNATAEMTTLQGKLADIERVKPELEARAKAAREGKLDTGIRKTEVNPLTAQWKGRNKWFGDPKFVAETRYAAMIDQEMAREGMNPTDPAYFTEWDRRIKERMPTLSTRWRKESGQPAKRAPVTQGGRPGGGAAPARGGARGSVVGNKVTITPGDKQFMREMGMDPTNKDHLQAFAKERLESMQGGKR